MKKLLSTLFLIVVVMQLHAQVIEFTVTTAEGVPVPYKILTGTEKQFDASVNEVGVSGTIISPTVDVIIPSTVTYGGVTYTVSSIETLMNSILKYRSWKQEKEKNAYLIEIEDILPAYSLSCINRNRLRKE